MGLYERIVDQLCHCGFEGSVKVISGFKAEIEAMEAALISAEKDQLWLRCLEAAGVDNWNGFHFAYDIKRELLEEATA
jgi:hypothetical protein